MSSLSQVIWPIPLQEHATRLTGHLRNVILHLDRERAISALGRDGGNNYGNAVPGRGGRGRGQYKFMSRPARGRCQHCHEVAGQVQLVIQSVGRTFFVSAPSSCHWCFLQAVSSGPTIWLYKSRVTRPGSLSRPRTMTSSLLNEQYNCTFNTVTDIK
jgi:hypothetical protein